MSCLKGGGPLVLHTIFLELSSTAWSRTCSSSVLPAGHFGERPALLTLRCMYLGEMPRPLPGARLSGSCLPREASVLGGPVCPRHKVTHGGTTTVAVASSPALESAPAVSTAVSQSTVAWMVRGWGVLICTVQGCPAAGASLLPCIFPASAFPGGTARSWAVSPVALGSRACAARIALGPHSPLCMELPPELLLAPCRVHTPAI